MKHMWLAMVTAMAVTLGAQGAIVETARMADVATGVTKNTLIVFDIDNTILQSSQTLGSVQWNDWYTGELKRKGIDGDLAADLALKLWIRINLQGGQTLVESVTPNVIANLQARGAKVIALTARSPGIAAKTLSDLPKFGINFHRSWPSGTRFQSPFEGAIYSSGVIFVGNNSKGAVLREFMRQNSLKPSSVRFVDDKIKYVQSVEQAMAAANIPYTGYRYGGADYRVNHFDTRLAVFVTNYYQRNGIILSDAQARRMMQTSALATVH